LAVTAAPATAPEATAGKRQERRALGVACGAHVLHDGYTDLVWIALPIWQAEFALSYAAVGLLRMIYSGTLASLQIPASLVARRVGGGVVLALGTVLSGLCYCIAGISDGFPWLLFALFLGGLGAATQHPIGSALVTHTFTGARALKAFATYNFAGDVGKVLLPASATTMILIMPWRPAYALLGLVGVAAAAAIFMFAPRVAPEAQAAAPAPMHEASAKAQNARMRFGFRILVAFGIADSVVRGAFFVCLPFLLIGKGAAVTTAGFALTLVFVGGAAGKLACGWVANWIGTVATIVVAQILTAAGIIAALLLPLGFAIALLPLLGIALNGVTTVIYGSVPLYSAPERRTHALSVFYTITIGSAAVAPPVAGFISDQIGIASTVVIVAVLTAATIPLGFFLKDTPSESPAV
jgi:FSR family fosmidomycin resistance protein-like MFS transporter